MCTLHHTVQTRPSHPEGGSVEDPPGRIPTGQVSAFRAQGNPPSWFCCQLSKQGQEPTRRQGPCFSQRGLGNRNERKAIKSVFFFYLKTLRNRKQVLKHKESLDVFGYRLGEEELGEGAGALQGRGQPVGACGRKAEPKPLTPTQALRASE